MGTLSKCGIRNGALDTGTVPGPQSAPFQPAAVRRIKCQTIVFDLSRLIFQRVTVAMWYGGSSECDELHCVRDVIYRFLPMSIALGKWFFIIRLIRLPESSYNSRLPSTLQSEEHWLIAIESSSDSIRLEYTRLWPEAVRQLLDVIQWMNS